ncbi:MAG: outer membrane beta-barrel protein [Gammaproteobacteria bacterium]
MLSATTIQRHRVRHACGIPAWLPGIAILAGVLAFSSSTAQAANVGWYVAADAGQSRFTNMDTYGSPIFPDSFSSTDTGYRLSAGYQIDPYFGVEAGYVHFGEVTGSNTYLGGPICPLFCSSYGVNANLKTHGWALELVGAYPFNARWAIFARAGEIGADSELTVNYTPIPPYYCTFCENASTTSTDVDVTYGLGVRWSFARHWAARLSWDRYVSLAYKLPMRGFNVNLTSIGVVYDF